MKTLKHLLILITLAHLSLFAYDARLKSYPDAKAYYENAVKGDATAAFNLAVTYHKRFNDAAKAIYWYKKAYEIGNTNIAKDAANDLGFLEDRTLKNHKEAEKWYKKAIAKGSKAAAYNLAYMYDEALHLPKQAIELYKQAYHMGQIGAANSIGLVYKNQLKNYPEALKWYKKAYEQGDMSGAFNIGYYYDVVEHDFPKAITWYKKAAKKGYKNAILNLAYVYKDKEEKILGAAYLINLIAYKHSKTNVFNTLTKKWHLTDKEIKQAYRLQKTLDIPKHYFDPKLEN